MTKFTLLPLPSACQGRTRIETSARQGKTSYLGRHIVRNAIRHSERE